MRLDDRDIKHRRDRSWRRQEKDFAASIGGVRNPGSGNQYWTKNDVRNNKFSVEAKYSDRASYSLKLSELELAEKNALLDNGRTMLFTVSFSGKEYVVMTKEDWEAYGTQPTG